jgi:hypothetical protein
MTEQKPNQAKTARKAESQGRRQREAQEIRERRIKQQSAAQAALGTLNENLKSLRGNISRHKALINHLAGFYDEIDKLAKGKSMLEATDLIVEQANDIIRDAKEIVQGDAYLDRTKQFVPAGNNPVYPDVLLVARTVQQCLGRFAPPLEERENSLVRMLREARTIVAALELFINNKSAWPSAEDLETVLDGKPAEKWLFESDDGEKYFNFGRLDQIEIERIFADES